MEELDLIFDEAKEAMEKALHHLESELRKIRAGKAHPMMLESVKVDYYGSLVPLTQVANVNTLDGRTLTVQPWEKKMLDPIAAAIMNANLGLNPQNNGEVILINIPPLTEERRKGLVKQAKAEGEHAKVGIRNARKHANEQIKKLKDEGLSEDDMKRAEEKVQKLTDEYVAKVDNLVAAKEKDILTV
ncbi:MAG TPA: ribosome recycling factor [Flavobacteriales bacterium]|nr:ribosome recycling factor [Flavobacteriales bacterium]|tara:strand:+ start:49037 stop:49597 length:561 start_codon:yes stop_codon:yes gene_type:complete